MTLSETDKLLLNLLQTEFPLVTRPFAVLGERLGLTEDEIITRLKELKEERIIRQISAIFDSRALGYQSCLVAFKVAPAELDKVAERISQHRGVTHNYSRNHEYNLWFTITVPPTAKLEQEVNALANQPGVIAVHLFPTIRLFKIGVAFDMLADDSNKMMVKSVEQTEKTDFSEEDILAIRRLQQDLPIESQPFAKLAAGTGISEEALIAKAESFLQHGIMRRYAGVLRHRSAGYTANAMGAWNVPENEIEDFGKKASEFNAVSHCYQRPTYPDWPYSVFTMIHGKTKEYCEEVAHSISMATGVSDYVLLYSTTEYKKTRMTYFEE